MSKITPETIFSQKYDDNKKKGSLAALILGEMVN